MFRSFYNSNFLLIVFQVLQDDRDVALKTRIVQLLSKEVPKKVEIGEHALHVINRRRRKKDNTLHRWKVDVQQPERVVHQEEKKDPQDLTSILIEDAFSTILSRKNPRGMSLNIRMSMKYNPIPMRTLEFEGNRDVRQSEGKSETVISDVELVEAALVEQKLEDQHQQRLKNVSNIFYVQGSSLIFTFTLFLFQLFATTTSKTTTAPSLHSNGEIKKRIINTSHIKLVNNLKK